MNSLVLLLAVLAASPNLPPNLDMGGNGVSTPNGIADFSAHGAGLPAWAPTPALALDGLAYRPGDTTWPNGGSIGGSLSKIGSPAAWYGSPFYPNGFDEATHYGATSFASANRFTYDAGLRFASDFWSCSIVRPNPSITQAAIIATPVTATGGWNVRVLSWTTALDFFDSAGATTTFTFPALALGQVSVLCVWRIGTTAYAQINAGAVSSGSAGPVAAGSGATTIGTSGTAWPFDGQIFEVAVGSGTTTAAAMRDVQLAAMRCAGSGQCIPETGTVVSHVTFDASANAVDSKGLTWTKNGSPTALQVPYVWPGNRTPLAQPATRMTSGNIWNAGNILNAPTTITILHGFRALDTYSGANYLLGKFTGAEGWMLYNPGASYLTFRVCSTLACTNSSSIGALESGSFYVAAVKYSYSSGAGSATVLGNLNGVAMSQAGMLGPIKPSSDATNFLFGQTITGGQDVAFSYVWDGWDASADELDKLVRWKMGLTVEKPASDVVAFSRNDSHSACCPVTDASCHKLGANMPCITSRGLERAGPTSNLLATSIDIGSWVTWSPGHVAPVRTSNTTERADPRGGYTAAKVVFPAVAAGQISLLVSPQFAQTAVPYSFGLWGATASGTWRTYLSCYSTGYYAIREVTLTPVWQRLTTTGTSPGSATQSCSIGTDLNAPAPGETATDAGTVYLWAGQAQQSIALGPYRDSTGTPYSGPHTDATVPWVNRNPDRWAFSILGTIGPAGLLRMIGAGVGGSGGNVEFYMNSSNTLVHQPGDGLGGFRSWSIGVAYPSIVEKRYTAFVAGTEPGAMVDGLRLTGALSGTWTGSIRFNPTTLRFGSFGASGASYSIEGHVKRVVQCPTERGCR